MFEKTACEYENQTVKSLKSGIESGEVAAHLQTCADCRETARVVLFFQSSLSNEAAPTLPAAGFVWFKSSLREKQRAAERAVQPIFAAQIIAAIISLIVFAWLYGNDNLPVASLGTAFSRIADSMSQLIFPLILALAGFAFVSYVTVLVMRRLLPEK